MAKFPAPNVFELIPEGQYPAVLVKLLDLGTQRSQYGTKHQVMLVWELIGPRTKDDRPFEIAKFCNFLTSLKSTFRALTEPMLGRKFTADDFGDDGLDLSVLLAKPCVVWVGHDEADDGTKRHIVQQVTKLPKGQTAARPERAPEFLWLAPGEFDMRVFLAQSQRVKDIIAASPEFKALPEHQALPKAQAKAAGEHVTLKVVKTTAKPAVLAREAAPQLETVGSEYEGLDPGEDRDLIDE